MCIRDRLRGVSLEEDETLRIGSLTSFSHITKNELIQKYIPVLGEAVDMVGGPQIPRFKADLSSQLLYVGKGFECPATAKRTPPQAMISPQGKCLLPPAFTFFQFGRLFCPFWVRP